MNEAKEKSLTELRQIAQLSDDVYHISVVLERFCDSSLEIEEIMHIQPIINCFTPKSRYFKCIFYKFEPKK